MKKDIAHHQEVKNQRQKVLGTWGRSVVSVCERSQPNDSRSLMIRFLRK